jgi:hypothetical protein
MLLDFIKSASGVLVPGSESTVDAMRSYKTGSPLFVDVKRIRNYKFHRKAFALFKLAFDHWDIHGIEYKGQLVEKDFERFRKDMIILAGFYRPVYNARGEVQLEAESLSFSNMSEERFNLVYRAVMSVVWERILRHSGYVIEADVDNVVNQLMSFDQ